MGEVEIFEHEKTIVIASNIVIYGSYADLVLAKQIEEEIETMWNDAKGKVVLKNKSYDVRFTIRGYYFPGLLPNDIKHNKNPKNNYIRIEDYCKDEISSVDDIGCNSGYWLIANLYPNSTTAAHEYGHTIGLEHPSDTDYRGKGVPGIMYPRGTWVDAHMQYDPQMPAGDIRGGGTLHPIHRKVNEQDIENLHIEDLGFENNKAIIGGFTNIYHEKQVKP